MGIETWELIEIYHLLRELGIYPKYRGYRYIATAVNLILQDETLLTSVTKILYPQVARIHKTTWKCVEHDMRKAISVCWGGGGRNLLERMAKRELQRRPTTVEFLDILANYILRYGYPCQ